MTPFEELYQKGCKLPIGWFETDDVKLLGVDLGSSREGKKHLNQVIGISEQIEETNGERFGLENILSSNLKNSWLGRSQMKSEQDHEQAKALKRGKARVFGVSKA
ncbi:hypothetical protein MTR67_023989 [Solanum verrucosum]|uniref:Uncharacterized protein n=1 Tax=Solanum verrucosum TaxID=315347 RepID=A0AAF0R2Z5_SOLVR|nr:hypothetical protein MTR67_023989 [Solanum verrucosum]